MSKTPSISSSSTNKIISVTAILILCVSLAVVFWQSFVILQKNSIPVAANTGSPQEQSLNQALDKLDSQVLH